LYLVKTPARQLYLVKTPARQGNTKERKMSHKIKELKNQLAILEDALGWRSPAVVAIKQEIYAEVRKEKRQ
jgi:hypothetical protein